MLINDYEKCVLGTILKYPDCNRKIPQRIVAELGIDKFGSNQHKKIYKAIKELVMKKEVPNTINVNLELGSDSEDCGGVEYLESLIGFPQLLGTTDDKSYIKWIRTIDSAGRLRHLGQVMSHYQQDYKDFEKLVSSVPNVDEYLGNFVTEINKGVSATRTSYRPISEAVSKAKEKLKRMKKGEVVDIIPCGLPSLEKYYIPRPCSFGTIIGLSSLGKTSLGFLIALGVAINLKESGQEGVVSINSLETSDEMIAQTMACIVGSVDSMQVSKATDNNILNRYEEYLDYINDLPIVYDDNPDITTNEMAWQAMALHIKQKRVLGLSDYSELFKDEGKSEELRISTIVRNHWNIAWRLGSCEILLSQASNPNPSTKMVMLSDARYSRAFENALHWGIVIYNPKQMRRRGISFTLPEGKRDDMAYWIIQKNKHFDVGEEVVGWTPEYSQFNDILLPIGKLFRGNKKIDQF